MAFADDYVDVATRIVQFRERYPQGSLQPVQADEPIKVFTVGDKTFLQYVAAAYRTPDDQRPGIGIAWEQFPGKTSYTRDSEAMVCETSAWGRAIVAALAADTKKGIASAEEVRNRVAERETADDAVPPPVDPRAEIRARIKAEGEERGWTVAEIAADFSQRTAGTDIRAGSVDELNAYLTWLSAQPSKWESGDAA